MTTTDLPFAAVIIPHFNDHARLERCLEALWRAGVPSDIEVVVVDNGSEPPLGPIPRFEGLRVVKEHRKGAANARNRGVTVTTAPRLWFLDADCVPAPDWLDCARQVCSRAEIVGGDVTVFDESAPPRSGAQGFETVFAFDCRAYVQEMGFAVTANLLTRRDIFYRAGPFIDGVPEDKEWCQRAIQTGAEITFAPELRVSHPSRSDWPALRHKWVRLTQESWAAHRGKRFAAVLWALRAMVVGLSGLVHMRRVFRSPQLEGAERWRAALTLVRLRLLRATWMMRQVVGLGL